MIRIRSVLFLAFSSVVAIQAGPVVYFSRVSDMRAASAPVNKTLAIVGGYHAERDGGGGEFLFDNQSAASADQGYVMSRTVPGSGRWLRINSTSVTVRQFGAKGDNVTDDQDAFTRAINYCKGNGFLTLRIPAGRYRITQALPALNSDHKYISVIGEGGTYSGSENATVGTTLIGDGMPANTPILSYAGGSGNSNTGIIQGIAFRGKTAAMALVGVRVAAACGVRIRDCDFRQLRYGVVFSNNLPGAFTEYSVAENCNFDSEVTTALLFERGEGSDSFHGSGMKGGRINLVGTNCEAPIQIGALDDATRQIKLYNAPLDFQTWTRHADCPDRTLIKVNSHGSSLITTHGTITIEDFGGPGFLAKGTAKVFHAGSVVAMGANSLGNFQLVDYSNINSDGTINMIPKAYNATVAIQNSTHKILDLDAGTAELGGLMLVRVSASDYEYRCLLLAAHNGYGSPGYVEVLKVYMDHDNRGFGDPAFSVNSNGGLFIDNPGFPGNNVNVQLHVMPSGGKKENFLK